MKNLLTVSLLLSAVACGAPANDSSTNSCDLDGTYRETYTTENSECPDLPEDTNIWHHTVQDCNQSIDDTFFVGNVLFNSNGYISCVPGNDRTYECDGQITYNTQNPSNHCAYVVRINHVCGTGTPASVCK